MRYYVSVITNTKNGENRKPINAYSGETLGEDIAESQALAKYHSEMSTAMSSADIYGALITVTTSHGGILVMDKYGLMVEDEAEEEQEDATNNE